MSEQLLQVKNLVVNVEDTEILHGIDLEINRGETHVLMGPNGAGKSTLGYALMGSPRYQLTNGQIWFKGQDITEESTDKSSQQSSDKDQKSNYIICHFEIPAADHCLKGTNRTGTCGPGAGIAVQPRNTYIFQFSGINLSSHKSGNMTVCKRRPQGLNPMARPLINFHFFVIQFQYTPYRY